MFQKLYLISAKFKVLFFLVLICSAFFLFFFFGDVDYEDLRRYKIFNKLQMRNPYFRKTDTEEKKHEKINNENSTNILTNNSRVLLTNGTGVLLTNRTGVLSTNGTGVLLTNRTGVLLTNRTGILLANRTGVLLTNRTGVLSTNGTGVLLTNRTGVLLTNRTGILLANRTGVLWINGTGVFLTNKTGVSLTNRTGVLLTNRTGTLLTNRTQVSTPKNSGQILLENISVSLDINCYLKNSPNFSLKDLPNSDFEFLKTEKGKEFKTILALKYEFGPHFEYGFGKEPFELACCKEKRCFMTARTDIISPTDFDAVIIHFRSFKNPGLQLPKKRNSKQRYIFYERESPVHSYRETTKFNGVFNWTMTYRRDSDIVAPYGYSLPKSNFKTNFSAFESKMEISSSMKTKSEQAVWVASNCFTPSNRDDFVQRLSKYIKIDVYGWCGTLKCSRTRESECFEMFERNYKFYLSLENSLCKDYVTEKFYRPLRYNIVPVVRGAGPYSSVGPPNSYIDANDFKSEEELAKYLIYLDKNDTAYMEYFRWKKDYFVIGSQMDNLFTTISFCDLCQKLHQDSKPKIYHNLQEWFNQKAKC